MKLKIRACSVENIKIPQLFVQEKEALNFFVLVTIEIQKSSLDSPNILKTESKKQLPLQQFILAPTIFVKYEDKAENA